MSDTVNNNDNNMDNSTSTSHGTRIRRVVRRRRHFGETDNRNVTEGDNDMSIANESDNDMPIAHKILSKIDDIKTNNAKQLYNKIRCLQDPYPNAFIVCGDGKKLYLKLADYEK